ncbi:hypothetical protein AGJ34_20655 [Cronobacter dublinensis subsp. dublinensis]|nr:hypothetical protein [Cronobacter dublinensis subsp. dublinensis]EGT5671199.1 hypothetical protein [Cronobacter dublinensis subsp. dublinensis]EGT5675379.1 hypothetical protein [Cronobacter dublinensis subsp. dublinensis]EGT5679603.1 hypothetical protein [Cronobacter dublinensis subsp. dublinensis]EGT5691852.1 hypothetical protein [Cronobacter dublinensis subsp. dublinensis]
MVLRAFWLSRTGGGLWHMEESRARRFEGSAIWKVFEPPFMPFGHDFSLRTDHQSTGSVMSGI